MKKHKKTLKDPCKILKLLNHGAYLAQSNAVDLSDVYDLRQSKTGITLHLAYVDKGLVLSWISSGALCEIGRNQLHISSAGKSMLKRLEGGGFEHQHMDCVRIAKSQVCINRAENPLQMLAKRCDKMGRAWLEYVHVQAGERLRADFTYAQMSPKISANWTGIPQGKDSAFSPYALTYSEVVLGARARVQKALQSVGTDFADVLLDVCCFLKGVEELERNHMWPQRSGKLVLRFALEALAKHYGLESSAKGTYRPKHKTYVWAMDDYRSRIS